MDERVRPRVAFVFGEIDPNASTSNRNEQREARFELVHPLFTEAHSLVPRHGTSSVLDVQDRDDLFVHGTQTYRAKTATEARACSPGDTRANTNPELTARTSGSRVFATGAARRSVADPAHRRVAGHVSPEAHPDTKARPDSGDHHRGRREPRHRNGDEAGQGRLSEWLDSKSSATRSLASIDVLEGTGRHLRRHHTDQ